MILVDIGVYDPTRVTAAALANINTDPPGFIALFSQELLKANRTVPSGLGVSTRAPIPVPTTAPTVTPTQMAMVEEVLKDLEEEAEAEEAAAEVATATSAVVASTVVASVGGAVASSVSASVGASAAGAAGAGGAAAGAGAGAGAGGGAGGGGAVVLVFALQKLAVVSRVDTLGEKMPLVAGLGKEFEWANMMFTLPWGSNSSNSSSGRNSNTSSSYNNNSSAWSGSGASERRLTGTGRVKKVRGTIAAVSTLVRIGSRRFHRWWHSGAGQRFGLFEQRRQLLAGFDGTDSNTANMTSGEGCAAEILKKIEEANADAAPVEVPSSGVDVAATLDAKFQGNLFWGFVILVFASVLHIYST
jgi:hypothetical protein